MLVCCVLIVLWATLCYTKEFKTEVKFSYALIIQPENSKENSCSDKESTQRNE